jgi:hypothetical protein
MLRFGILHRREEPRFSKNARSGAAGSVNLLGDVQGAALLEFAISLPLLVVFVVGIYDFSGAFNQKQKIEQAAQEGAIVAGAQPTSDIASPTAPDSLLPVVAAVFNSLAGSGVIRGCALPAAPTLLPPLTWKYKISGCPDDLFITINRGCVCGSCLPAAACASGPPFPVGTVVTVVYPYTFRFNSVIQLLFPGATYAHTTPLTESATVHNQM